MTLIALWCDSPQQLIAEITESNGIVRHAEKLVTVDFMNLLLAEPDERSFFLFHETVTSFELLCGKNSVEENIF